MINDEQIQANRLLGRNAIRTAKYSVFTFFPMNLLMQFQKAPNIYFLIISIMQTFAVISISNGKSAMAMPLVIIVLLSMIKDAYEDYKRHQSDAKENDATTLVLNNS